MKVKINIVLVDKLVDQCTETTEEEKLAQITLAENESLNKYSSCTVYIVLMIQFLQFLPELLLILFIRTGLGLKIMFFALDLVLKKKQKFYFLKLIIFTMIKLI